jgi:hypothetical protein
MQVGNERNYDCQVQQNCDENQSIASQGLFSPKLVDRKKVDGWA